MADSSDPQLPFSEIDAFVQRFPQLYHNHASIAAYLEDWADRVRGEVAHDRGLSTQDQDYLIGYQRALTDVAYHLRQGDCLPGGPLCQSSEIQSAG